jgi:outer membrane protein assembly factor BamD (BamD/ComL family)
MIGFQSLSDGEEGSAPYRFANRSAQDELMKQLSFLIITLLTLLVAPMAHSQSAGAAQANRAAYDAYMSGNYEEAAKLYDEMIKNYPTDMLVSVARVQLAFSRFFLGQFDESQKILEQSLADPALPAELKPVAMSFLPQIFAAQASALPPDDPKRRELFEQAIKKYDAYLSEFPNGEQVESVVFGRALANYQIGEFEETAKNLEGNLERFPRSPTILDSQNLLAITLATLASRELVKGDEADRQAAAANFERSKQLLQDIINRRTDLTLVNDAQFQLAEIMFNMAGFAPEDERADLYRQAMQAYREVSPNEEMIALQEAKLATFPERRTQLLRQQNQAGVRALEREFEREQRRLGELRGKPDQISTASLRMAEIFFSQGDYNRTRVLLRHVTPFLGKDEDQKRALYFLTMTYALQNLADQAVENYQRFQEQHKGDPLAQNLPLAIGNIFLNHPNPEMMNPGRAIEFFNESLEIYPEGQLSGLTTVTKASAQTRLGQLDEARQTFEKFLAGSPSPQEAVVARTGLADVYKLSQDWENAAKEYARVREEFPGTQQALDAQFWLAACAQQKGQNEEAITQLRQFISDQPESAFQSAALYSLGTSLIATGANEEAIATFAELAEKYPDSQFGPFSYFMRGQILMREQKKDEVNALMREFIEKYPDNENIFNAFDTIGTNLMTSAQIPEALEVYREFLDKHPTNPRAAEALLKIAEQERGQAERMGRYGALDNDERQTWEAHMQAVVQAVEQMLQQYPDSPQVALALTNLLAAQNLYLSAQLRSPEDVQKYFEDLADASSSSAARSKILFALASFLAERDEAQALATMLEAYDPEVIYAPSDIDFFGLALIENNEVEKAQEVFAKLAADYPNPPNVQPNQAPPQIQQAQAVVLFGQGRVAQAAGNVAEAGQIFQKLKELYPWSPKSLEADFGIAEADFQANKLDEALVRLPAIIRSPNATPELRAKATMLGGNIMLKRSQTAATPEARDESLKAAIDYFLQIAQFYGSAAALAAEGLWKGGQLLEQQAAQSNDAAFRTRQLNQARRAFRELVENYPNSQFVEQAQQRLQQLGN